MTTLRHTLDGYIASPPKLSPRWGGVFIGKNVQIAHISKCRRLWNNLTAGTLQPATHYHDWERLRRKAQD